jgi:two-component sensor histidine kinase/ABC-type amino acid transport substrate-binding protein
MTHLVIIAALLLQPINQQVDAKNDSLLTADEISWLLENEIRFAPNSSWPPGDFIDEQGNHSGIVADYIQLFEEKLGFAFQKIFYRTWAEMLSGLENGEADFVGAMQKTDEREQFLLFTEPFIQIPNVILIRNDYPYNISSNHLKSMTLAGVAGYASLEHIRETYPVAEIQEFEDDLTALLQTSLGSTDGTVIDLMTASYLVEQYGISNLKLGLNLNFDWELRMASRNELPELHSILNKLLAQIDSHQHEEIFNKWVNIDLIQEANFFERNQTRLILLLSFLLFAAVSVTVHNYNLKTQVSERTKDLKASLDEKNILLSEIHHRVKNNLAITSSLLQLEMMQIEEVEVLEVLSNSLMRIKSIALVHENLYETLDFKQIPFHSYLDELIKGIKNNFDDEKEIQVIKSFQEIYLNINLAIPAALLVNELVTNAFKYAFNKRKKGIIEISLKQSEKNIELSVKDNGIGLPDIVNLKDKTSVSFVLMNTLANQLNAKYEVQTKPGTQFTFTFRNVNKKGSSGNYYPK